MAHTFKEVVPGEWSRRRAKNVAVVHIYPHRSGWEDQGRIQSQFLSDFLSLLLLCFSFPWIVLLYFFIFCSFFFFFTGHFLLGDKLRILTFKNLHKILLLEIFLQFMYFHEILVIFAHDKSVIFQL